MTYYVTIRDIVRGEQNSSYACPVARSIKRRHSATRVAVGSHRVDIGLTWYKLPMRVWRWIDRFDAGQSVRPMRFELL